MEIYTSPFQNWWEIESIVAMCWKELEFSKIWGREWIGSQHVTFQSFFFPFLNECKFRAKTKSTFVNGIKIAKCQLLFQKR